MRVPMRRHALAAICSVLLMPVLSLITGCARSEGTEAARNQPQQTEGADLTPGEFLMGGIFLWGLWGALAAALDDPYLAEPPAEGIRVIEGVRVINADGSATENATITISGDTIQSVIAGGEADPKAVRVIDGSGKTAIAGLIDAHVHFIFPDLGTYFKFPTLFFIGTYKDKYYPANRRKYLQNGVTTVRSMGDPLNLIKGLKEKTDNYELGGPRIYYAGKMITAPDGHPSGLYSPGEVDEAVAGVGTVQEGEAVVDHMHTQGAQIIKIIYGSTTLFGGTAPQLNKQVMEAIIKRAHSYSPPMMVAAHVETLQGATEVIQAGVDAIEHVPGNAEALAQLAGDHRIFVTPTLSGPHRLIPTEAFETLKETVRAIHADGRATIVTGTDLPFAPADTGIFDEMELLQDCGLAPLDVLRAATVNAARVLGQGETLGEIATGRMADIVLLECDPLEDIACLREENKIVIQRGRVVFE